MTSGMLPIIKLNAELDLRGTLPLIINHNADLERVMVFCQNYRRRGICSLFLEGLPRLLHGDLQRSGTAFLHGLLTATNEEKITSKAAPFFDAVACKDFRTAREIARHSRHIWNEQEEYEDDFLYVFFLMSKFFLEGTRLELNAIIERYVMLLDGAMDVHCAICKSFFENDSYAFEASLSELLSQKEDYLKCGMNRDEIPEEEWVTEGLLSVEGIALVRLAEIQGFKTGNNYLFVPSIVLENPKIIYEQDSWKGP